MTHGSLYTGIGMWLLAAWKAGMTNVFTCENDNYCNAILDKRFPNTDRHYDIKETDFKKYRGKIDVLTTSDPCQPFSYAGKREGATDVRFLWPETIRAIQEIQPAVVVFENVPGIVSLAFTHIEADLEREGYEVEPFSIPACAIGAPHRRERLWILAYSNITGACKGSEEISETHGEVRQQNQDAKPSHTGKYASNTNNKRSNASRYGLKRERSERTSKGKNRPQPELGRHSTNNADTITKFPRGAWDRWWTTESGLGGVANGYAYWMDEPVPRLTTVKTDRTKRIKSIGNAIVPQLGYVILETIKQTYFQ